MIYSTIISSSMKEEGVPVRIVLNIVTENSDYIDLSKIEFTLKKNICCSLG